MDAYDLLQRTAEREIDALRTALEHARQAAWQRLDWQAEQYYASVLGVPSYIEHEKKET